MLISLIGMYCSCGGCCLADGMVLIFQKIIHIKKRTTQDRVGVVYLGGNEGF